MSEEAVYDENSIQVLSGYEALRRRPSMYVGDVRDGSGLHHLVWEVVGNAMDLHLARRCSSIRVDIHDGWVEVEDDGPGIAMVGDTDPLPVVVSAWHQTGTRDGHWPHVHLSAGFLGVGLWAVNGLCEDFEIETRWSGQARRLVCHRGDAVAGVERLGRVARSGTRVRFRPDPTIFPSTEFDVPRVEERLHELAYLNPALEVMAQGKVLRERAGLAAWARRRAAQAGGTIGDVVVDGSQMHDDVWVDFALAWTRLGFELERGFVSQNRVDAGTHIEGAYRGIADALGVDEHKSLPSLRELFEPGLVLLVHAGIYDARFGNPTRERVLNPEVRDAVREVVADRLRLAAKRVPTLRAHLDARVAPMAG